MFKDGIDGKDFFIGTVAMSLNDLGKKLSKKRDVMQDKIASTDDFAVRIRTAFEVDKIIKQFTVLTTIVDCLEKRNSKRLLEIKDEVELFYLQVKKDYPDYEEDLSYVKNCFIYNDSMEEFMKKGLICVSFEEADNSIDLAQEACLCAVREAIYNRRLMESEGKTDSLVEKQEMLKIILNYFWDLS